MNRRGSDDPSLTESIVVIRFDGAGGAWAAPAGGAYAARVEPPLHDDAPTPEGASAGAGEAGRLGEHRGTRSEQRSAPALSAAAVAHSPPRVAGELRERLRRLDRPGPRYTSYPTALEFGDDFGEAAYAAALARAARQPEAALALYAHLPFCQERCLYCACNVVITRHTGVADAYLARLTREIAAVAPRLGNRRRVTQLHLGGGTPTYYAPDALRGLMAAFRRHFELAPAAEIALEVDPRVTAPEHLEALAEEGFNRLSIGVQDFDPEVQRAVHREQSVEATGVLMEQARSLGFTSLNLDLIYGLPYQTPASLERTLADVVGLRPDRLAVYSFAYLPAAFAHQRALPEDALPRGEAKLELLELTHAALGAAGYVDIGMDHFALPGDELVAAQREGRLWRNFMGYTAQRAPDLVGFGLSAIGEVGGAYAQNEKKLNRYQAAVEAGGLPVARGRLLSEDDLIRQHLIREWMCHFRVDKGDLERSFGIAFDVYFADEMSELEALERDDLVRLEAGAIEAGELGRLLPRNVAMVFDRYLRNGSQPQAGRFSRTV